MTSNQRHEPLSAVQYHLAERIPAAITLPGAPAITLRINPQGPSLGIRTDAAGPEPDVTGYRNLQIESLVEGAQVVQEMTVFLQGNEAEVYPWLCAIADRIQLEGESFAEAVQTALRSLGGILALRQGLAHRQRVGLFGELVVLLALADASSSAAAINAWRGPLGEEHDFGTSEADLEVKTTENECRIHMISGPTQLVPTLGRPLYLVSIQITAAPAGVGVSLPQLVAYVRDVFAAESSQVERLLTEAGYREVDGVLYTSRWTLRSVPASFEVTSEFPAISQGLLDSHVPSAERLSSIFYRVDVTGLVEATEVLPFGGPKLRELFDD